MADDSPLLALSNVRVMADETCILDLPALTIGAGESAAILGANGSGKSTLVKLIARQLYPLYGADVRIFGQENWNVFELRRLLGIVSSTMQLDFDAEPPLEVLDCVVSGFFASRGLWAHQHVTQEMVDVSRAALEKVGASRLIGRSMASLSTGEARRVLIARALAHRPRALLLDEPCAGLDPAARHHFLDMLRGVARGGTTMLLITHHIEEILPEIGRIVMLRGGKLFRDGAKAELLTSEALSGLFDLPMAVTARGEWFDADIHPQSGA
ncbi:ABC transporter ATP-binding protein [Sphingopyxis panaciterrulae]|uniref:Iron complex transport system ATP-binding protein n=1 Tax=Sphingopyxis panaciterrulae TaxID=462372 RepID=A0A7W9B7L1_9SPHN|nr:ATP-binding cassette domain-containing protein [Sphingopyxis panaciterrulae]MBB5707687.1 iron complex transport system ATP-binding protein [Sphingopyxis panaciterrulae]